MKNAQGYGTDPMPPEKLIARYERKSTRMQNGCLIYPKEIKAARRIYFLRHGPIPDDLMVCHTCDTPDCIEDSHHWLGTNKENQEDAARKGQKKQSPEHKEKLAAAKRGRTLSAETRAKIGNANKGKIFSESRRKKISAALKGRVMSAEWIEKLAESHKGRPLSATHKQKISQALFTYHASH